MTSTTLHRRQVSPGMSKVTAKQSFEEARVFFTTAISLITFCLTGCSTCRRDLETTHPYSRQVVRTCSIRQPVLVYSAPQTSVRRWASVARQAASICLLSQLETQ